MVSSSMHRDSNAHFWSAPQPAHADDSLFDSIYCKTQVTLAHGLACCQARRIAANHKQQHRAFISSVAGAHAAVLAVHAARCSSRVPALAQIAASRAGRSPMLTKLRVPPAHPSRLLCTKMGTSRTSTSTSTRRSRSRSSSCRRKLISNTLAYHLRIRADCCAQRWASLRDIGRRRTSQRVHSRGGTMGKARKRHSSRPSFRLPPRRHRSALCVDCVVGCSFEDLKHVSRLSK